MTAALALALLATPQPFTLRYAYEVGQERRYVLAMQFGNRDLGETTGQREELIWKVEAVDAAGVARLSLRRRLTQLALDEQNVPITATQEWLTLSERRNPRGFVRDREPHPQDPTAYERLQRLFDWTFPVTPLRVGDTWRAEGPADDGLRAPAIEWSFRLESANETEVRVRASFRESAAEGISGSGLAVLNRKTGWPIRLTMQVQGVVIPGDELRIPMSGTFELTYQAQATDKANSGS